MSYHILRCHSGRGTANKFVYDTSDKSIEFITYKEFDRIKDIETFKYTVKYADESFMARLMMSSNGYKLYCDSDFSLVLRYKETEHVWRLYLNIISGRFTGITDEYDQSGLFFNWCGGGNLGVEYAAIVPEFYIQYIIENSDARNREISKILNYSCFTYINEFGKLDCVYPNNIGNIFKS